MDCSSFSSSSVSERFLFVEGPARDMLLVVMTIDVAILGLVVFLAH